MVDKMNKNMMIIESRKPKAERRTPNAERRTHYFDFLRVLAVLAVIALHTTGVGLDEMKIASGTGTIIKSYEWYILKIYSSLTSWCVPVFIMISGALFLNRNDSIRKIYSKNITRIITAFLFWSFFYAIVQYFYKHWTRAEFFANFLLGHYHLWFLFMIICLYMLIPLIRKITESDFLVKYFLFLTLIFAFVLPQVLSFITCISEDYGALMSKFLNKFELYRVLTESTGYFLLGYYLTKAPITKKTEYMIYAAGMIGYAAYIAVDLYISEDKSIYPVCNVLAESIAIFVFFMKHCPNNPVLVRCMSVLSRWTFGAYLVHDVVKKFIAILGLKALSFNPAIAAPFAVTVIFIVSFMVSCVLNSIPVLKKYIV